MCPLVTRIALLHGEPDQRAIIYAGYHIFDFSPGALAAAYSALYGACAALIATHLIKHRDII